MSTTIFYSHGKLLVTGEYVVLDGAKAFALPTNQGQYLAVKKIHTPKIVWRSFDEKGAVWFEEEFSINQILISPNSNLSKYSQVSKTLIDILRAAQQLNTEFLSEGHGVYVTTRLTFPREFGLGTSSTLIANIAKWAKVNPFDLLCNSFKGSGYDIACANSINPLVYQLNNKMPNIDFVDFNPPFKEHIYFVYLNKKQDSKEGIAHYKTLSTVSKEKPSVAVSAITEAILSCRVLKEFNTLIDTHETIVSELLQIPTVKEQLFKEYKSGSIKSLGAWGGDFIMVTVQSKNDLDYFRAKGYTTILGYQEMILS